MATLDKSLTKDVAQKILLSTRGTKLIAKFATLKYYVSLLNGKPGINVIRPIGKQAPFHL